MPRLYSRAGLDTRAEEKCDPGSPGSPGNVVTIPAAAGPRPNEPPSPR